MITLTSRDHYIYRSLGMSDFDTPSKFIGLKKNTLLKLDEVGVIAWITRYFFSIVCKSDS